MEMSLKEGEITFDLGKPFDYFSKDGNKRVRCDFILLREPTGQHSKYYQKLKQWAGQAEMDMVGIAKSLELDETTMAAAKEAAAEKQSIIQAAKDVENDPKAMAKQTKADAEQILLTLEQSNRVDLADFVEMFSNMVCAGTDKSLAACNKVDMFTREHWNLMHPEEHSKMAAFWYAFFVTPSNRGQAESGQPLESQQSASAGSGITDL